MQIYTCAFCKGIKFAIRLKPLIYITNYDGNAPRPLTPSNAHVHHRTPSNHPSDPGSFSGAPSEDLDKWLHNYNRVSVSNNWDPTIRLANVIFYLQGTVKIWFDNHGEEILNWDALCQRMRKTFRVLMIEATQRKNQTWNQNTTCRRAIYKLYRRRCSAV